VKSIKQCVIFGIATIILLSTPLLSGAAPKTLEMTQDTVTSSDIHRWMTEISNWGRWGKDDQLGAINLITPTKRKQAAALVEEGISVSLARSPQKEKTIDNPWPYQHTMIRTGLDDGDSVMDTYTVSYHGLAHTHLDALCHNFYQGKMYNGFPQEEVTEKGCPREGIEILKDGIFTRGILIDIPSLKGVPYLEPGTAIYAADLEAWEKKTGIRVSSGDVIFVRTGRWARQAALGAWDVMGNAAGLHASVAMWLKERDVAMMGSDAANDVTPSGIDGNSYPLHRLVIVGLGMHLFDNCDLEALSKAAAQRNRWEFLLTVAPIPVPGGTGSPVNPIATF
jgi:kynurenine formamidase